MFCPPPSVPDEVAGTWWYSVPLRQLLMVFPGPFSSSQLYFLVVSLQSGDATVYLPSRAAGDYG